MTFILISEIKEFSLAKILGPDLVLIGLDQNMDHSKSIVYFGSL